MDEARQAILSNLQLDTAVRAIFLFSPEGYLVSKAGYTEELDTEAIGALVSGEFAAAESLARLIGNQLTFTSNYHEGPEYSMYVHGVKGKGMLVMIFGTDSNLGIVRYYTGKTVDALESMLSTGILPPPDAFADPVSFEQHMNESINTLFDSAFNEEDYE